MSRKPASVATAAPTSIRKVRCAVYTRKSTDEGLEKEFNSLDAQREAELGSTRAQTETVSVSSLLSAPPSTA